MSSKQIVLTGDRPTGKLHLGHFVGSIQNRIELQSKHDTVFYMVADVQALTDNAENPDKVRNNVLEVVLDNLACGVDPSKTIFFIQSQVPEIAELTVFFLNLTTVSRLAQNPTIKTEMAQKGYRLTGNDTQVAEHSDTEIKNVPAGFLCYPVSQTADILAFKANVIPVGEDQLPVIEQANEIGHKFNTLYGEIFPKITPVVSTASRLVGIDGGAKMSKSLNNAIYLSDTPETIEQKVMQMYTDPNHIRVEDPGNVEGNVVFQYLDIFDTDKEEVASLKAQYQKGGLGDVVIKKRLIAILQDLINPIREQREYLAKDPKQIMDILEKGTARAREYAKETLAEAKRAMKIEYF